MTTLKQNLMERSMEIKFLLERELRGLYIPCSITDMVKRVRASRMPVEKHLKSLLATKEFADFSIVRVGGVDVIYRVAKPTTLDGVGTDGTDKPGSELGGSKDAGQTEQPVLPAGEQHQV